MKAGKNKQRTLRRIAVTRAWFAPVEREGRPRHAFHMDVAFHRERLGGGEGDPVRFRIGLKRCEIVVILPRDDGFVIDEKTISSGIPPATVSIEARTETSSDASASAGFDIGPSGPHAGGRFSASRKRSSSANSQQVLPVLLGTRALSEEGHMSWTITRTDGGEILEGELWDARHDEPRFELVDRRPPQERERDIQTGLHATLTVEVRCKREDLSIDDIALTDPEERTWLRSRSNQAKRVAAAEAFIKRQLQREGLRVGNIHEPFSNLVVGDLLVALVDDDEEDL